MNIFVKGLGQQQLNNFILAVCLMSLNLYSTAIQAFCDPKSNELLVIHSYHPEYPWVVSYTNGIKTAINNQYSLAHFYMDTKRVGKDQFTEMAQAAWDQHVKLKPKGIFLSDDNALKYVGPKFIDSSDCPVVYLGINNNPRHYKMLGHPNISGVLERPLIKRSMLLMKQHLLPIKKAMVLFDSGTTAHVVRDEVFGQNNSTLMGDTAIDIYLIDTFETWKETVLSKHREKLYDVIYIGLYHTIKDANGNHVNAEEIIQWTSKHATLPLFSLWDFSVGEGKAIGGYVLFGEDQGQKAGERMLEMLDKPETKVISPITGEVGRYVFSQSEFKRWKLKMPKVLEEHIHWVP
jgi:hypothetical protein